MTINTQSLKSLGCVAYYPFRDTMLDATGQNDATADLTYIGNQTGYDHLFIDGISKVTIPEPITASTVGTFCGWIMCNATADMYIVTRSRTTANRIFAIGYWYTSNQMRLKVQVNNSGAPNSAVYVVIKDPFVWHHVAVVANGSTWTLYVNGSPQNISIITGTNIGKWGGAITSHDYYAIGTSQVNNEEEVTSTFHARDFMFFNTALDKDQVNDLLMNTIIY